MADGKQGPGQLRLVQAIKKVALILVAVLALEQLIVALELAHLGIVTGRDLLGAERQGVVEEGLELDFGIAQHVRVGRPAGLIFAQEFGEHAILVFGGKIHHFKVDADDVAYCGDVDQILPRRTILAIVVIFPVLHEQADDLPALLFEEQGGHGGINAAGHADDHGFRH